MYKRSYKKLIVWRESHALCLQVYKLTKLLPEEEKFSLVKQMRRSAYSIPMNIVEGNGRSSKKERKRFIEIAASSLEELHYQCFLVYELGYMDKNLYATVESSLQKTAFLIARLKQSFR